MEKLYSSKVPFQAMPNVKLLKAFLYFSQEVLASTVVTSQVPIPYKSNHIDGFDALRTFSVER